MRTTELARATIKQVASRLGLHVRPYRDAVQGLDPWRDATVLLGGRADPTILDVGANEGQSATTFSRVWPHAVVHCFEPSPEAFTTLQHNVAGLNARVHPVNVGVGAEAARSTLLENSQSEMSSFLAPADESWGQTTRRTSVDMITVDDYCAGAGISRVDMLKSDTQGYDLEVLKGAATMLDSGAIRLVFLELIFAHLYEDVPSLDAVYRFLSDRQFHLVGLYDPHHMADGRMAWCDMLFVHGGVSASR